MTEQWQLKASFTLPAFMNLMPPFAEGSRRRASLAAHAVAAPEAPAQSFPAAPQEVHGFTLQRAQWVQEYNSQVLLYRHEKTGEALQPGLCTTVPVSVLLV